MSAYALLLLENTYLPGILAVRKALSDTNAQFPVVLLYSAKNVNKDTIALFTASELFSDLIDIDDNLLVSNSPHTLESVLSRPDLAYTLSKINLWRLVEYSKLVYLDADTLPLQNLDHLFAQNFDALQVMAAPDCGWPDLFNSGFMVLQPNMTVFQELMDLYASTESFDGADQGLLNHYFNPDLYHGGTSRWLRLPFIYNCTLNSHYEYFPAMQRYFHDIKLFHFIGDKKPWDPNYGEQLRRDPSLFKVADNKNVYELWHEVYESIEMDRQSQHEVRQTTEVLEPEHVETVEAVETAVETAVEPQPEPPVVHHQYYYKEPESEPEKYEENRGEAWKLNESRGPNKWEDSSESEEEEEDAGELDTRELARSLSQLDVETPQDDYAAKHPIFPWEKSPARQKPTRSFSARTALPSTLTKIPFTAAFDNGAELENYIASREQTERPETLQEIEQDEQLDEQESQELEKLAP
ncbi:hypothetical protein KL931_003709 [Ogataea haglerorum]|nr:hypothetical protein KL931_003709 [Ogataea haglerorum]